MNNQIDRTNTYVLYHSNCFDGTGAKYAAWTVYGNAATYIPVQYGNALPEIPDNSEVFILDFSYDKDTLYELYTRSKSLLVLDHHKTAEEALRGVPYAQFDMNKSGAVMAWNHFHPETDVPRLLLHVQDRDLWKWDMENTKAVTNALPLIGEDMDAWNYYARSYSQGDALKYLIDKGQTIEDYNQLKVKSTKSQIKIVPFKGYKAGVFNTTTLVSEIGNEVCKANIGVIDFAIGYFISRQGEVVLSFRSLGAMDVSELAKQLGGGGHRNAAGAKVDLFTLTALYSGAL